GLVGVVSQGSQRPTRTRPRVGGLVVGPVNSIVTCVSHVTRRVEGADEQASGVVIVVAELSWCAARQIGRGNGGTDELARWVGLAGGGDPIRSCYRGQVLRRVVRISGIEDLRRVGGTPLAGAGLLHPAQRVVTGRGRDHLSRVLPVLHSRDF